MADITSPESRTWLFLGFLIVVLVIVNSQSLQVSHQSKEILERTFTESARVRLEAAHRELQGRFGSEALSAPTIALSGTLEELVRHGQWLSACLLDWNGRVLAGSRACQLSPGALEELGPERRRSLLEDGWTLSEVSPRYPPEEARVFGYRAQLAGDGSIRSVLRLELPASEIAAANQRFRMTLIYQVSAFSLLLLTLVFFLNRRLAPHRRLVAEARSVARDLAAGGEERDEGQFLLATFQGVVTRLKEKEQELAAMHRREKLRADETEALATDIIRSMTTGLLSVDPSGTLVLVNPAAERLFRQDAALLVGRRWSDVFGGSAELASVVADASERGTATLRKRIDYRLPSGETLHLGASIIPLGSGRSIRGAICLLADLTEVIQLRERLFLKENFARLGEMAAGIAHEFRNGLATILGNARLLEHALPPGESQAVARALIEESNVLSRVVTEFLQFARPESIRFAPIDLAAVTREVVEELRPRARAEGVRLVVEGVPSRVEADEVLLRKAVGNLVLNAIEAAANGRSGGDRWVRVSTDSRTGFGWIEVADNGRGVPDAERAKIFSPFYTTKPEGTGLGLSLVQKIVLSHNGEVSVEPSPEGGALFKVKIPERAEPSRTAPEWW